MAASKKLKNKCFDQRGFTLIEVMISAALLLVAIVPMITLMEFSSVTQRQSQLSITAANVANEEMEKIKGAPYTDIGIVGSSSTPGIFAAEEDIKPSLTLAATFTVTRSISWFPSDADNYAKKVIVSVSLAGQSSDLATLTNYLGPTGMLPFDEEQAETDPPNNVAIITPANNDIIQTRNVTLTATASDASPGRMLMVKYFIKNMDITGGSFYGYRLALYDPDPAYRYQSVLDSFVIVEPEPKLPDADYEIYAQAIDLSGNITNSSVVAFTLAVPPTTPINLYGWSMPSLPDTSATVNLMWDPSISNDPFAYAVLRRSNMGGSWGDATIHAYVDSTETQDPIYYEDFDIVQNQYYRYRVRAVKYDDSVDPRIYGLESPNSNETEVHVF